METITGWSNTDLTPPTDDRQDAIEAEAERRAEGPWSVRELTDLLCVMATAEYVSPSIISTGLVNAINSGDFLDFSRLIVIAMKSNRARQKWHEEDIENNEAD